jgi:hypothetical protein
MFLKGYACFLFLDPRNQVGPSIYSSVVLCSFVLSVCIAVLVLLFCFCPPSIRVVATFWYCFSSFTMFCAKGFSPIHRLAAPRWQHHHQTHPATAYPVDSKTS